MVNGKKKKSVYDCFANVITSDWNKLIDHPHVIVYFFESISTENRDKGSTTSEFKVKSLNGRWFTPKKGTVEKKESVIERGSVIT